MTEFERAYEDAKAELLPYECWEKLAGETPLAYAAFSAFRDLGPERNIRRAVETSEKDKAKHEKRYHVWRNWSNQFRWRERAEGYDRYIKRLKQTELRKTIEAQGEMHRAVTGKMLEVVSKKLDSMNPEDLTQGNVTGWVETAIRADREAAGLIIGKDGKTDPRQGELVFTSDFQGL